MNDTSRPCDIARSSIPQANPDWVEWRNGTKQ